VARPLTVVQLLPALESGGVERSTLEIAAALTAAGHRAVVISAGGRLLPALLGTGAEHIVLPIGRKSPWSLRHIPTLRRIFRELEADVVHARSRLPAWLALRALRGASRGQHRSPHFVTTVHGLNSPGRYSRVMTRGERVICVSETVRAYLLQHYSRLDPGRLVVIPRGVDVAEFPRGFMPDPEWRTRFASEFPQLVGGRLLLLPGRGTRLKGHAHALRLLAGLRASGIDARLLLAGADQSGRERYLAELHAQIAAAELQQHVVITPPRADIRELYAVSDLVLQLSEKPESFGRTVLEALAIGRPVLGWDHGGVGELLHALYPAGAVPLRDAAQLLSHARELLSGTASTASAAPMLSDRYTLARMQHDTLELYARLAHRDD
jgi:glycosyltransferase involved in cell wall biosynthesis